MYIYIKQINKTGGIDRKVGSGQRWMVRAAENIGTVGQMICSQQDQLGTHINHPRNIPHATGRHFSLISAAHRETGFAAENISASI